MIIINTVVWRLFSTLYAAWSNIDEHLLAADIIPPVLTVAPPSC